MSWQNVYRNIFLLLIIPVCLVFGLGLLGIIIFWIQADISSIMPSGLKIVNTYCKNGKVIIALTTEERDVELREIEFYKLQNESIEKYCPTLNFPCNLTCLDNRVFRKGDLCWFNDVCNISQCIYDLRVKGIVVSLLCQKQQFPLWLQVYLILFH